MLRWGRMEFSGGFLFWMALLWYLDLGRVLACYLAAALLHEWGHAWTARRLGARIRRLRLTVLGAEMTLDGRERLSYGGELLVEAAGPAVNLLTGLAALALGGPGWLADFAGASLVLGVFNLLPLAPLDGGQMVRSALSLLASPEAGERAARWAGLLLGGVLLALGVMVALGSGYNLSLLAVALWALTAQVRKSGGFSPIRA